MLLHNITGGDHPWYVFKGNPISKVNKLMDHSSVVDYDIMPTPLSIAQAFNYLNQGPNYDTSLARGKCKSITMPPPLLKLLLLATQPAHRRSKFCTIAKTLSTRNGLLVGRPLEHRCTSTIPLGEWACAVMCGVIMSCF